MIAKDMRFFLVREDILPEALAKTIQAKELMNSRSLTISEAIEEAGLSRSAFYKYRDKVFPFTLWNRDQTVILEMLLEHRSGVLSAVLNSIAQEGGNILTINQNIPQQGAALATITIEITELQEDVEYLLRVLRQASGVKEAKLLGA